MALPSVGGYLAFDFYEYTQEDPSFCRRCHIMEDAWDRWASSEHSTVQCHSCHQLGAFEAAGLLWEVVFGQSETVTKHAVVSDKACEKCHEGGDPGWVQAAATSGHRVHAEEENIACVKCHSTTVHRFVAPGVICNTCHEDQIIRVSGMSEMHCASCHEYLAEGEELLHMRKGCLDCHLALANEEATWPADAAMQFPCDQCHQPHEAAEPFVDCLSCHPDIGGLHDKGVHSVVECQTCHEPHEWQVPGRETCLICHPDKVEHNLGAGHVDCHSS